MPGVFVFEAAEQTFKIKTVMEKEAINKVVGDRLKAVRKVMKFSQDDLSAAIGLTRTSVVNIEKGRQSLTIENLYKISEVFKINPMDLLINTGGDVNIVLEAKIKDAENEKNEWKGKYLSLKKSLSEVFAHIERNVVF
jgi:transcriptional regulator with XRE-family HTH domain